MRIKRRSLKSEIFSYIGSRNWPNLAEVLYKSANSSFDHFVRLHHGIFPVPGQQPPSVKLVVFQDMNTIPDILQSRISHAHPRLSNMTNVRHHPLHTDGTDGLVEIPSDDRGLAEYTAQDAIDAGDEEETDKTKEARLVIQRAARRHILKRTEESSNDALAIGRHRLFKSCKATTNDVHVKYRKIYLGPVPHLLLCLEWLVTRAESLKADAKRRRAESKVLQEKLDLNAEYKLMG